MVSKRPDAICLHCGNELDICDIAYIDYINMNQKKRNEFRENYKKRVMLYAEKMNNSDNSKPESTFL